MKDSKFLPPFALQIAGLIIVVGAVVFWAVTGHQSALVMGAGLSLTALGAYSGLHISIKQDLLRNNLEKDNGE